MSGLEVLLTRPASHRQLECGQLQAAGVSSSMSGQSAAPSHTREAAVRPSRPAQVAQEAGSSDMSPHSDTPLHH